VIRLTRGREAARSTGQPPAQAGPVCSPGRVTGVTKERAMVETGLGRHRRPWELSCADVDITRLIPDMTRWFAAGDRLSGAIVTDARGHQRYTLLAGHGDPWPAFVADYPVGTRFNGRVVNTGRRIGAFVAIAGGINGRVPAADARQARLTPDMRVEAEVMRVDPAAREVALRLRRVCLT